jgi:hypothetical protein
MGRMWEDCATAAITGIRPLSKHGAGTIIETDTWYVTIEDSVTSFETTRNGAGAWAKVEDDLLHVAELVDGVSKWMYVFEIITSHRKRVDITPSGQKAA